MKKIIVVIFFVLFVLSLVSCSQSKYIIVVQDYLGVIKSIPQKAECGETVEIQTCVIMDADIEIYVDGEKIDRTHFDSDYWGYTFTMPDHDVIITTKTVNGFLG